MTKQEWSEHLAKQALDVILHSGRIMAPMGLIDDLKRLSEGDYPGMCFDEKPRLFITTGAENHLGIKMYSGESLPNQLFGAEIRNDEGVAILYAKFHIDGERVILGDPK